MDETQAKQVRHTIQIPDLSSISLCSFLLVSFVLLGRNRDRFLEFFQIIEQQVLTVVKAVEDKLDEEIAALDRLDLDDLEALRERRLHQLKKMAEKRSRWISLGHSEYSEIPEKEFFAAVKASDHVVCHFYRENWPCKVMDKHLSVLAKQHIETRFLKIHAEKSPFLTEKLRIVVLPTLALVKNAKVEDYVVGFDELGGTDDFSTEELEERLAKSQVILFEGEASSYPTKSSKTKRSVRQTEIAYSSDSE
ncbi:Thioredoxin domain-containing protein 9 [Musa troglodytarum]|uniref:Thioredoxin domain-containing protein 9 n=1 Tax=Musa troglodytarum TaxID=320322 RepID=A0A9E7E8W6_9LILI|nr:Thioredoxin domain-containing protein 9 [Musa troglodytarum]